MDSIQRKLLGAIFLILFGIIYIIKPSIFRRGIWMKTSIAIKTMSPEKYNRYMRSLGMFLIILGVIVLLEIYKVF